MWSCEGIIHLHSWCEHACWKPEQTPMRLIIIFIALLVIVMVLKRLWQTPGTAKTRQIPSNRMVQCSRCGLYIPESEALEHDSRYYCSQAHLDADAGDNASSPE